MSTKTINLHDAKYFKYIATRNKHENWTLCVGAGICLGILPSWNTLTINLINEIFNYTWTEDDFKEKNKNIGFSLDSWIQGCQNYHININQKTKKSFNIILEKVLYKDLLEKAKNNNILDEVIKLFEKSDKLNKIEVYKICNFFDKEYSNTTLLQLVKVLSEYDNIKLPQSIITFNADSLLPSLLRVYQIKYHNETEKDFLLPKERYVKITSSYNKWGNKIPIFQLHGTISPTVSDKTNDNREKLIFLEDSYTELASNIHSWTQSTFLYTAQNNKLIFLGLSMTDPNIRKWLGWTNTNNINEINKKASKSNLSLEHLWITTKKDNTSQTFLDVSMHHLGVKLALINSWDDIGNRLKHILTK